MSQRPAFPNTASSVSPAASVSTVPGRVVSLRGPVSVRTAALRLSFALAALGASGSSVSACTACFGKTDESMAQGMNAGIYVMLAFVVAAWVLFGSFFVFIARRSRRLDPDPGTGDTAQ